MRDDPGAVSLHPTYPSRQAKLFKIVRPITYSGSAKPSGEKRYESIASKEKTGEKPKFTGINDDFESVFDTAPGTRSSFSALCQGR
jgi:hypothetical protein